MRRSLAHIHAGALTLRPPSAASLVLSVLAMAALWASTAFGSLFNVTSGMDATTHYPMLLPAARAPFPPVARSPALGKGVFLVASRKLKDRNFAQTVVLLVHQDKGGAMGVIINRPTTLRLSAVLPSLTELADRDDRVFFGGPVGRHRLVLLIRSPTEPPQAESVFDDVYVSASEQTLRDLIGRADAGDIFYAYVGYAGWAPHQLEQELERGDWYIAAADANLVFSAEPATVWPQLIKEHAGRWVRYPNKQNRVADGTRFQTHLPMPLNLVREEPFLCDVACQRRATRSPTRSVNGRNNRMEVQL